MTLLGTIALIVLVIFSVLVLRVKSDPMDKKSIREALADAKRTSSQANHSAYEKNVSSESASHFEPPHKG